MTAARSSETAEQSTMYGVQPQKTDIICNYKMKASNSTLSAHSFG
jgi:hypothetical protein